mmetsp:Transcript_56183/g.111662  ORF Transcript_56183/g.111662 Transcript_56183/m.111662 type:complete len:238 (+) Transcript_56183:208-921(+)
MLSELSSFLSRVIVEVDSMFSFSFSSCGLCSLALFCGSISTPMWMSCFFLSCKLPKSHISYSAGRPKSGYLPKSWLLWVSRLSIFLAGSPVSPIDTVSSVVAAVAFRLYCFTPGPTRKATLNRSPSTGSPAHFSSILPQPFAFLKLSPLLASATCLAVNFTLNSKGAPWMFTQKGPETHCRDVEFTMWFSCTLKTASVAPVFASSDVGTSLLNNGTVPVEIRRVNSGIFLAYCGLSV